LDRSGWGGLSGSSLGGSGLSRSSELLLSGDHSLNTIVHVLHKLNLRQAKTSLVGYIVDVVGRLRVLSVDTSNLDFETVSDCLEFRHSGAKVRKGNVDGSSKSCAEVGRAGGDVAKLLAMGESGYLLDLGTRD